MTKKMIFLNCPVCQYGIDAADNDWPQIRCPNCKIDIARQDWVVRETLVGKYQTRPAKALEEINAQMDADIEFIRDIFDDAISRLKDANGDTAA